MPTSSIIALKENGDYFTIYCHFDGYPDGVGKILHDHYCSLDKVKALLELGDLSALGERLSPRVNEKHSFTAPAEGVTIAYRRDRGELLSKAETLWSILELKQIAKHSDAAYVYVFDADKSPNCWNVAKVTRSNALYLVPLDSYANSSFEANKKEYENEI